jgi:hypothetical protein
MFSVSVSVAAGAPQPTNSRANKAGAERSLELECDIQDLLV